MMMHNIMGFNPAYGRETRRYMLLAWIAGVVLLALRSSVDGPHLWLLAAVAAVTGGVVEVVFARVRRKPVTGGAVPNGLLLALLVPATVPWWMMAVGAAVGTLFAKEAFGGEETCIFNPPLIARAFLLVSYPAMAGKVNLQESLANCPQGAVWAAGALLAVLLLAVVLRPQNLLAVIGMALGAMMIFCLVVGPSHFAEVANLKDCQADGAFDTRWLLLNDNWLLVAVLFALAPQGLPRSAAGKLLTGLLMGVFGAVIRCWGRYPDSMTFAVLIVNAIAPTLDWLLPDRKDEKAESTEPLKADSEQKGGC